MLRWLWLSALVVALDQATKWWAQANLLPHVPRPLLPHLDLTLMFNRGAAFSFLSDQSGWQRGFFTGLAVVSVVVLTIWLARLPRHDHWTAAGIALIIGGAIGNAIDRVRLGHVVDFIDFWVGDWHWPAFNIADSAITVGALLLVLLAFRGETKAKGKKRR
ncbi:MAG: lipoprotein signal peptidase [Gammaproteobacteria bacterium]|nr:MAG: lipoprotein signal peptidase [Gammaproteobacteria bacterium]